MIVYTYIPLLNSAKKNSFDFRIVKPNIYFKSFAKIWNPTSNHNISSSFSWLYEFEILHAKVFLENMVKTFEETSVSTRYIKIYTLIFQKTFHFISTSSLVWSSYSFEISKLLINITCIKYTRMIIIFI